MIDISFDERYTRLVHIIKEKRKRKQAPRVLNPDVLKFIIHLLSKNNDGKTLIPDLNWGELSLCVADAESGTDAFTLSKGVIEILEEEGYQEGINSIYANFLETTVDSRYHSMVIFPPHGVHTENGRSEELYIEKSLALLAEGGRAVMIIPQQLLMYPAFRTMREMIIDKYSLEAVFTMNKISRFLSNPYSILVVENKPQSDNIYMSLYEDDLKVLLEGYEKGTMGFWVPAKEVYDRFDANYYDPEYKEIREKIQRRDTKKLGEIANIYSGMMIPPERQKPFGDYVVIQPRYIFDGVVHDSKRKIYCDSSLLSPERRRERFIIRNGDVLISMFDDVDWALYRGENDYAVAGHRIVIVRGKEEYEEWLRLFFSTRTGIESLEGQLKFFSHGAPHNKIQRRDLAQIYVPDIATMRAAERVSEAVDLEAKVTALFKELGWKTEAGYKKDGRSYYDLALFDNGTLKGVVEVKAYKSSQIVNNQALAEQLSSTKKDIGNIPIYLFVDDELYEYDDGSLEQLLELPRPGKKEITKKPGVRDPEQKTTISIEKGTIEEISISDKALTELTIGIKDLKASMNRIEGKVDDIAEKLELLSKQLSGYQSLVKKQLEMAASPEEVERIIHAFSEECAEKIIVEVEAKNSKREYNAERNKLIRSFGEEAWNKMNDSSKTFLVSSKVIFNNLVGLHDIVDYSGVCLLVTKALEVEMGKRFCKNYIAFLKERYPGKTNHALFPTSLLDQYGHPIRTKHFTLGSLAHILCYLKADELTEEQEENNKAKLIEYSKAKLFSGKTDDEIMKQLLEYAESVEKVKKDYRNPSAHTNELRRVDAEECFDLLVDVEKLMKKMLDSFDE